MSTSRSMPVLLAWALSLAGTGFGHAATPSDDAARPAGRQAADLAGTWDLSLAKTDESCRVLLRPQRAYNGDYYIGFPSACRHAMPDLARTAHWARPDATHLTLTEQAGKTVLALAAAGDSFTGTVGDHLYTLKPLAATGRSAGGLTPVETDTAPGFPAIVPVSKRAKPDIVETPSDLGGRYAVMRQKRDTGCMVTLDDKSRVKGGARAQLAPGCRDQGIVIFDPTSWTIVRGELVLTARAGHKAHLLKAGEGVWEKDTKDGSKPLGLKKL